MLTKRGGRSRIDPKKTDTFTIIAFLREQLKTVKGGVGSTYLLLIEGRCCSKNVGIQVFGQYYSWIEFDRFRIQNLISLLFGKIRCSFDKLVLCLKNCITLISSQ